MAHPPARHGCRTQARGRRLHGKAARRHDNCLSHAAPGEHTVGGSRTALILRFFHHRSSGPQNRGRAAAARGSAIKGRLRMASFARREAARLTHLPRGQRRASRPCTPVSAANADKTGTPRAHRHSRVIPARPVSTRGIPGSVLMTMTPSCSGRPRRTAVRCADIKSSLRR